MLAVLSPANPRVHEEGFEPSSCGFKARRLAVSLLVSSCPRTRTSIAMSFNHPLCHWS